MTVGRIVIELAAAFAKQDDLDCREFFLFCKNE
jgi:hypothetical protein